MPGSRDPKKKKKKQEKKVGYAGMGIHILVLGGTLELCPGQFLGRRYIVLETHRLKLLCFVQEININIMDLVVKTI